MSDVASNNKRIAKNTVVLYIRMLFTLAIGLYTSRVVLATLGVSDYGLYNVVGGVVAMFGFLNATLSSSTQRYLNFELGTGNVDRLKTVFSTAFLLHLLLVAIVLVLAETVGLWFVLNKLNIPAGRENAALWVYQFSIIAVCVQIFQLPFMSNIIAHENMDVYAYVSIYDVVAKLLILFLIQVLNGDKLILYGALFLAVQLSEALIYNLYCQKHYVEARIRVSMDKPMFREMLGFSGWNVIGNLASVCNNYGLNIIFNLFFGTVVNAARGLSYQVNSVVLQFANNFQLAVKPQVVKYYANGQNQEMTNLVFNSAKFSALLMLLLSVPIAVETDFILKLWLGTFPENTALFIRIVLLQTVLSSMMLPILMVVHASGFLKAVGITAGVFDLLLLPLNYLLIKLGCGPHVALLVNACGVFVDTFIELFWMWHYIKFPIGKFYRQVYLAVFPLGLIMFVVPWAIDTMIPWHNDWLRFIAVCSVSLLTSGVVFWKWGLDDHKRSVIISKIRTFNHR